MKKTLKIYSMSDFIMGEIYVRASSAVENLSENSLVMFLAIFAHESPLFILFSTDRRIRPRLLSKGLDSMLFFISREIGKIFALNVFCSWLIEECSIFHK